LWVSTGNAHDPAYEEDQVKAEMVERFCRFIDWPENAAQNVSDPFVIGIYEEDGVAQQLREIARTRRIQGRLVEVRRITVPAEALSCHLVWAGAAAAQRVAALVAISSGHPILTVGNAPGLAEAGVLINIVRSKDRLAFEVNLTEVVASRLRFSSKLLRLARIVETRNAGATR